MLYRPRVSVASAEAQAAMRIAIGTPSLKLWSVSDKALVTDGRRNKQGIGDGFFNIHIIKPIQELILDY